MKNIDQTKLEQMAVQLNLSPQEVLDRFCDNPDSVNFGKIKDYKELIRLYEEAPIASPQRFKIDQELVKYVNSLNNYDKLGSLHDELPVDSEADAICRIKTATLAPDFQLAGFQLSFSSTLGDEANGIARRRQSELAQNFTEAKLAYNDSIEGSWAETIAIRKMRDFSSREARTYAQAKEHHDMAPKGTVIEAVTALRLVETARTNEEKEEAFQLSPTGSEAERLAIRRKLGIE